MSAVPFVLEAEGSFPCFPFGAETGFPFGIFSCFSVGWRLSVMTDSARYFYEETSDHDLVGMRLVLLSSDEVR